MLSIRQFGAVLLLWLCGVALRLTVLAMPAVIALVKTDLDLSATAVGIVTGLPVALFAIAAVPGSLLISRVGAVSALISGLLITAIASALRALASETSVLYATTTLMGFGVAIMQPALPHLVRAWLPGHVGFGTAVYTNGLLAGEILPVALTALILPLIDDSWRLTLILWSLPVMLIALLVAAFAPRAQAQAAERARWWPEWTSGLLWRLGLIFGSVTSMYFTANGFLPVYLASIGHADLIGGALSALNAGQIPASFLLLFIADRVVRRGWPYIFAGLGALISILVLVTTTGSELIVASAVLGFCCGAILILALALPPLLCAPGDVARTSAGVFTLSYGFAVIVPIVSGALWDRTGIPASAFIPLGACALMLLALTPKINFHGPRAH